MHTNQTGRFPATSSRGNKYVMVLVKVDGNFIDAEPMKNRSEGAMIKAYQALWTRLTALGAVKPKTHILDNEASTEFKKEIQKNCTIQAILTLNLSCQANAVPTISVWQYVHGNFDYNKMPLAPMGCVVQLYQNSERTLLMPCCICETNKE